MKNWEQHVRGTCYFNISIFSPSWPFLNTKNDLSLEIHFAKVGLFHNAIKCSFPLVHSQIIATDRLRKEGRTYPSLSQTATLQQNNGLSFIIDATCAKHSFAEHYEFQLHKGQ